MSEHSFELVSDLPCSPDRVWAQVMRPALFLHVTAPLVRFTPIGRSRFPDRWDEGEYRGSMRLFGVIPIGWQAIVISFPQPESETGVLRDAGYSPLLPKWDHRIEVSPSGDRTRYVDRVTFDAGLLSPLTAVLIRLFFRHRQRRLRALARDDFAALES